MSLAHKHATVSRSGAQKISRAVRKGWTPREPVGPCKFLELLRGERKELRRIAA